MQFLSVAKMSKYFCSRCISEAQWSHTKSLFPFSNGLLSEDLPNSYNYRVGCFLLPECFVSIEALFWVEPLALPHRKGVNGGIHYL